MRSDPVQTAHARNCGPPRHTQSGQLRGRLINAGTRQSRHMHRAVVIEQPKVVTGGYGEHHP